MSKTSMNLQDSFLNQVRRENVEVKVLLVNGASLRGVVRGFDNFTVVLGSREGQHLVYKHAIAQLVHRRPLAGLPGIPSDRAGSEGVGGDDSVGDRDEPAEGDEPVGSVRGEQGDGDAEAPKALAGGAGRDERRGDRPRGRDGGRGGQRPSGHGGQGQQPRRDGRPQGGPRRDSHGPAMGGGNPVPPPLNGLASGEASDVAEAGARAKRDGFNMLDLSAVRLAPATAPSGSADSSDN